MKRLCLLSVFLLLFLWPVCQADTRSAQLTDLKIAYLEHMKHPPREKASKTFYAVGTIITDDPEGAAFYDNDRLAGRYFSGMPIEAFDPPANGTVSTEIDFEAGFFASDCVCFDPELLPEYMQFVSGRVLRDVAPHAFDNPSALYLDDRVTVLGYKTDPQGNPTAYLVDTGKAWFFLPADYIQLYTPASFEVGQAGFINTAKVNARKGAGKSNARVCYAEKGQQVWIDEIKTLKNGETWLRVTGMDDQSSLRSAWVKSEYVFAFVPANMPAGQRPFLEKVEIDAAPYQMNMEIRVFPAEGNAFYYTHSCLSDGAAIVRVNPETAKAQPLGEIALGDSFSVMDVRQTDGGMVILACNATEDALWAVQMTDDADTAVCKRLQDFHYAYEGHVAFSPQGFFVMDLREDGIHYTLYNQALQPVFENTLTEIRAEGRKAVPVDSYDVRNDFCSAQGNRFYLCFTLRSVLKSVLCCFDVTGRILWNAFFDGDVTLTPRMIFQEDRLYLSLLKEYKNPKIYCFSTDGELLWKKENTKEIDFRFAAQGEKGLVALSKMTTEQQYTLYLLSGDLDVIQYYRFTRPDWYAFKSIYFTDDGRVLIPGIHTSPSWNAPIDYSCVSIHPRFLPQE